MPYDLLKDTGKRSNKAKVSRIVLWDVEAEPRREQGPKHVRAWKLAPLLRYQYGEGSQSGEADTRISDQLMHLVEETGLSDIHLLQLSVYIEQVSCSGA